MPRTWIQVIRVCFRMWKLIGRARVISIKNGGAAEPDTVIEINRLSKSIISNWGGRLGGGEISGCSCCKHVFEGIFNEGVLSKIEMRVSATRSNGCLG